MGTDDYLLEFSRRIPPEDSTRLQRLMRAQTFQKLREPRRRKIMKELESFEVMNSWADHKRELSILLKSDLLSKADKKRYFYMRESLREAGRSTLKEEVVTAVKTLIRSDFLPLLSDPVFRSYLSPLLENGHLEKLFNIAGDYSYFRHTAEFWGDWSESVLPTATTSDPVFLTISTLMRLVEDSTDDIRAKARRIRDSEYFEPSTFALVTEELYRVFLEIILKPKTGSAIQKVMEEYLLIPAIKRAHIDWESSLIRSIQSLDNMSEQSTASFLRSEGFRVFANSRFSSALLEFQKAGVLKDLPEISRDWSLLLDPRFKEDHEKVQSFMKAVERERRKENTRLKAYAQRKNFCYKNMDIFMGKREEYNLKYREEVDLQMIPKRERFFKLLGNQTFQCPDSGHYQSGEFGWIYCTIHGKARFTKYE